MKKLLSLPLFLLPALCLCSCEVNWFGETLDAPWYAIAIPVALIAVVGYFILMSKTYVCPECGTEFKAKPWQLSVMVHSASLVPP